MNAILNKNSADVRGAKCPLLRWGQCLDANISLLFAFVPAGCTIYVALFPCNECAKLIIQSGIRRVVFKSDKYKEDWKFMASRRMFDMAGVECVQHTPKQNSITIDFGKVEGVVGHSRQRTDG